MQKLQCVRSLASIKRSGVWTVGWRGKGSAGRQKSIMSSVWLSEVGTGIEVKRARGGD